jgi:hypothetical protein
MDFARLTLGIGVDKDGASALAETFGKFRRKLMAGTDFNVFSGKPLSQQTAGVPAQRVVTSQGVAVADDKNSG